MRDHGWRAPECADEEMRDALPGLAHGRLAAPERRAVEAHLAACASCTAELAVLRDLRGALVTGAPALDLERLAAGVIAGTRRPAADPDVVPLAPRREA
ncbi:zf-HC2 domain-containing protein, partial [Roseisolibacter sp. H3M3-2]|uniref:zf-HC2 domain-containing protein n=1 Tax=Roseisolibacter sp. H3M3-2 TaxID=3031323 RepID=UPI0023DAF56A